MPTDRTDPAPDLAPEQTQEQILEQTLAAVRACRVCAAHLPHERRPVVRLAPTARILVMGQAPGRRVHETGVPWNDASGDRLRDWMGLDRDAFYDTAGIAIVPAGFCYPGTDARGGDRPPRPECAPLWHPRLKGFLTEIRLTLLVGSYAQRLELGRARQTSLTETVRRWREYGPDVIPLPHPSWRNTAWIRRNPWFEAELLPELRARVRQLVGNEPGDRQA
jgi:uracil-DNA glycosylase